jgi:hypothetical protein
LGAGKTHTLKFLTAKIEADGGYAPIYALLPSRTTSFVALYSAIVANLNWNEVEASLVDTGTWVSRSMRTALQWVTIETDAVRANLGRRWLRADRLTARECERLGVEQAIKTVDDAVGALTIILRSLSATGNRVVLMIDEYQRVAEGTRRQLQEVGHGVHTVFNACPQRVAMILSCASGSAGDLEFVLTPELVSRLSLRRIELPYMSSDDVVKYLGDLFAYYRAGSKRTFAPFTLESIKAIAEYLIREGRLDLTPRGVNEAFDFVFSEVLADTTLREFGLKAANSWLDAHGTDLLRRIV